MGLSRSTGRGLGLVAAVAIVVSSVAGCSSDDAPRATEAAEPSPTPEPRCPLSGVAAGAAVLDRPALAVKVENSPQAYPLAGLEEAEVVFEELVEGGITRFLAIYHCTDVAKVGPIRSARIVDAAIMIPITRILAAAGGNDVVRKKLERADIVVIDEPGAGAAMKRISRPGVAFEHTLYGNTRKLRELGADEYDRPPPDVFEFGAPRRRGKRVRSVALDFGGDRTVLYRWDGDEWLRFEAGERFMAEGGGQIAATNVVIEEHTVNLARGLVDVAGNASIEIADETGSGRALIFRDGRVIRGKWVREDLKSAVVYEDRVGRPIPLAPGRTWVALLPDRKGEVKGSYSIKR